LSPIAPAGGVSDARNPNRIPEGEPAITTFNTSRYFYRLATPQQWPVSMGALPRTLPVTLPETVTSLLFTPLGAPVNEVQTCVGFKPCGSPDVE
jgi:hypothetical protein